MKKRHIMFLGIILLIILILIFIPKFFSKGDRSVKYKVLESSEIPDKIKDILPKYLAEERALTLRLNNEIYVLVMRGEKNTGGYTVDIDKIIQEQVTKEEFDLVVHAKFKDPAEDDIVAQSFTYPFTIVRTNLKEMPENIKLEIEYE